MKNGKENRRAGGSETTKWSQPGSREAALTPFRIQNSIIHREPRKLFGDFVFVNFLPKTLRKNMPEGQEGEQLGFRRFLGSPLIQNAQRKRYLSLIYAHRVGDRSLQMRKGVNNI